jgi:hypothetical protein
MQTRHYSENPRLFLAREAPCERGSGPAQPTPIKENGLESIYGMAMRTQESKATDGATKLNLLPTERREQAEDALAATRVAQAEFWRSLSELESCLGIELDSTIDFRDADLETLRANNN